MNVTPGTIGWAMQAVRNAQMALQRAVPILEINGLKQEAGMAHQLKEATSELADCIEASIQPGPKAA